MNTNFLLIKDLKRLNVNNVTRKSSRSWWFSSVDSLNATTASSTSGTEFYSKMVDVLCEEL
jgi:hypothetical protein